MTPEERAHEALERAQTWVAAWPPEVKTMVLYSTRDQLSLEDFNVLITLAEDGIAARYGPPPRGGH